MRRYNLFARPEERKYVLVPKNNLRTPEALRAFQEHLPNVTVQTDDPNYRTPDKYDRRRIRDETAETNSFSHMMSTTSGDLYIEDTPEKQNELRFADIPSIAELRKTRPNLFKSLRTEAFEFVVTPAMIRQRRGAKRPISQNQAMGCSARDLLEEYDAIITESTQAHLAHRHGWSLGGAQRAENLDPGTAGSNYTTLMLIESPLKELVINEEIQTMRVHGTVIFHPLVPMPMEIRYQLGWGNGRSATISIYPLEPRKPTVSEYYASRTLLQFVRTPERAGNPHVLYRAQEDGATATDSDDCSQTLQF